jgi:hypothetical protein
MRSSFSLKYFALMKVTDRLGRVNRNSSNSNFGLSVGPQLLMEADFAYGGVSFNLRRLQWPVVYLSPAAK